MQVVEALEEQQVRELFHHFEGVRDAARPEGVPDSVDLRSEFAGQHGRRLPSSARGGGPAASMVMVSLVVAAMLGVLVGWFEPSWHPEARRVL